MYQWDKKEKKAVALTHFNDWVFEEKSICPLETCNFEQDGVSYDGWVIKPANFDLNKQYPAILDIHGGPKTVYGTVFYHEMQVWANKGYFVFFTNPTGSSVIPIALKLPQVDTWTSMDQLWWHSPLKYANQAKTPTLFIHSNEDYRCPYSEGLQMYSALLEHGVEVRLCMFKGENHFIV